MKKERTWNLAAMALGVFIIIIGIVFMFSSPKSASTDYPQVCEFGADFYTEQYAATRDVAYNTAAVARNIHALSGRISVCFGLMFIMAGLLVDIHYGKILFCVPAENAQAEPLNAVEAESAQPVSSEAENGKE